MNDKLKEFIAQNKEAFDDQVPGPELFQRVKGVVSPTNTKVLKLAFRILKLSAAAVLVFLAGLGLIGIFRS